MKRFSRFLFFTIGLTTWFAESVHAQRTASNPLGAQLNVQDAGTCSTTNSFAWQTLPINAATTTVNLAGTFSGTLTIRLSNNGGGSWTTNSTTTTAGTTSIATSGFTDICADITTFTSGIFQVTITTGLNTGPQGPAGPAGSSSIGAAFNVKSAPYNAVGNGKVLADGVSNASNNQLTSATATFTASDLNQNISCVSTPLQATATLRINSTVTSFVNSSTIVYGGANPGVFTGMECALTNPADPAAILSAFNASKSTFNSAASGISFQNMSGNIYLPAGIYGLSNTLDNLISSGTENCVGIIGDGDAKTVIIPTGSFVSTLRANGGYLINGRCVGHFYKDFSVDMVSIPTNSGGTAGVISVSGANSFVENVAVYDHCSTGSGVWAGLTSQSGTNEVWIHPTVVTGSTCPSAAGGLSLVSVSQATVVNAFLSNGNTNLLVQNAISGGNGAGIVFSGGIVDEGGIPSIVNSIDVWLNGIGLTGGANCLTVDATSFVWMTGGYCGTFGGGNGGGPSVSSGGVLNMTQVHISAIGAGNSCYTSAAYGGIVDDGTNRCTTSGGGTVYPAGGFVNKTSLSHLPFNAFQSGTLAAGTVQSFAVDQPVAVQSLSWTPSNAFACTAGSFPTLSITDGTVTLTTAATDTATNGAVTHTFPNTTASILNSAGTVGTVLQIKIVTTGTCGTAPTNVNINVWGQATAPGV